MVPLHRLMPGIVFAVSMAMPAAWGGEDAQARNGHTTLGTAPAVPPDMVMARFGEDTITAQDLDAAIGGISGPERFEYQSPEPLREMIEGLVDERLMAQAARSAGLDRDAGIRARLGATPGGVSPRPDQVLAEAYLERELSKSPRPSESDITRYYREHPAEFAIPARVRVTRAVAATTAAAEKLRAALARGDSPGELRAVEPQHTLSVDEVWLPDRPRKDVLEKVAFALKPGATSQPVELPSGYAVLRAEERSPAGVRPFAEVRGGIEARLEEERRRAVTERTRLLLRKGVIVSVDEAAVAAYLQARGGGGSHPAKRQKTGDN